MGNISVPFTDSIDLDTTGPAGTIIIAPSPFSTTGVVTLTMTSMDSAGTTNMYLRNETGGTTTTPFTTPFSWTLAGGEGTHTVYLKLQDGLGNISNEISARTLVDLNPPSTPVVTDDGLYSGNPTTLHAVWSANDSASGIAKYSVAVGTAKGGTNIVPFTDLGLATSTTFVVLNLVMDNTTLYYFTVQATDNVGRTSTGYSDGIKAGDPSPPSLPLVTDDGAFTPSASSLHATWTSSSDPESGVDHYEFAVGTTAGGTEIRGWVNVGLALSYTATGLSLNNGTRYYISVRAVNGGNTPTAACPDATGIVVDIAPPPVPVMNPEPTSGFAPGTSRTVSCGAVSDALSGGVQYFFERATAADFSSGLANSGWIATSSATFTALTHGVTFFYRVRTRDAVGNISAFSTEVHSRQDANAPTATSFTDNLAGNNDPNHTWSRDTSVTFGPVGLADDLSGLRKVTIEVASTTAFTTPISTVEIFSPPWRLDLTWPAGADGVTLYARARYEDVAGNISGWSATTDGIGLDLLDPVANATTDLVGNTDPNETISRDSTIRFSFTHSDSFSGVTDVRIQVASDSGFTQIATDVWIGNVTSWVFSDGMDNSTYSARILVRDNAGRESGWGMPANGIYIDLSGPVAGANPPFLINDGDRTTATSNVRLTFHVNDPSGVAEAQVSNDGVIWTSGGSPFLQPALGTGTYTPWQLDTTGGSLKTVHCRFKDASGVGHLSPIFTQTISYYPFTALRRDARDSNVYPVDTYDEYRGQNKYGADRSVASDTRAAEASGSSLLLRKP